MTIDDYITQLEQCDFAGCLNTGTPQARALLDAATDLFERFEVGDQLLVMGLMAGMAIGCCDGGTCTFELNNQTLIGAEDRIRVMITVLRIAARESAAAGRVFDQGKLS